MSTRNVTGRDREKVLFFYINSGSSYTPGKETRRRGRYNGALALADAETRMIDSDALQADWEIDPDVMSNDWIDADDDYNNGHSDPWHTWQLLMLDSVGDCVASLGGVDFGREGSPGSDNYARVCVAELASQHIAESDSKLSEDLADCAALKLVTDSAEKYANNLSCFADDRPAVLAAVARVRQ